MTSKKKVSNKNLSPANKLWNYIKIYPRDKFIAEYIDYIGFYADFNKHWYRFFRSDNGKELYFDQILLKQESTRSWHFLAYGYYSYQWYIVNLFRLSEIQIKWDRKMKFDFYWKWLLVVNRLDLRSTINKILEFWEMKELTITRTDYTVDCEHMSFGKKNSLNTRITWQIVKNWKLEYVLFWRKGKSARLLRYYDKKQEIIDRWTQWLYPEYFEKKTVMRYELQVISEWFNKDEREIKAQDLQSFSNFWMTISCNVASHKKKRELTEFEEVKKIINHLEKMKDEYQLTKIRLYLDNDYLRNE